MSVVAATPSAGDPVFQDETGRVGWSQVNFNATD